MWYLAPHQGQTGHRAGCNDLFGGIADYLAISIGYEMPCCSALSFQKDTPMVE